MDYKNICIFGELLLFLFVAQTGHAQEVLERFPIDRSTCGGGVTVTAYFDNNRNSGLQDYTCGTKTYEQHSGTDFGPYGSTRSSCSVVAAAPGEVLSTADGIYDQRSGSTADNPDCSNSNSYGNYVKIKQNDGSVVVYAHMKKGSIQVKKGDMVSCGQALGVAQSSGCSTGIHLHFDIAPKNGGTRFDPYKGSCGSGSSRWVSQGDYKGLPAETCQCTPNCSNKQCGDNGCGGSCGECGDGQICQGSQCVCVPKCDGKVCGDDGCGGSCGGCGDGQVCDGGQCVCVPKCDGKNCGEDGCGGSCGECEDGLMCEAGACVCAPQCEGRSCGDNGCGGICGECESGLICKENQCVCEPQCDSKRCGDDGCGGSCGACDEDVCDSTESAVCEDNQIKLCENGKYIYITCKDNQQCKKGKCVDNREASSDADEDEKNDAGADVRIYTSDSCSGMPSSRTNAPWILMLLAGMGGILRKRKSMKRC